VLLFFDKIHGPSITADRDESRRIVQNFRLSTKEIKMLGQISTLQ
jgi:hypothetical protein